MKYIDKIQDLENILPLIQGSPWAAVDTEADSLHHYVEKLCLIQISVAQEDIVIDPLSKLDLAGLMSALEGKDLILHGADFDIRMLSRFHGFKPKADVFDTMIAAQLLGYEKQGLADLVLKHCQVALSKSSQKADWSMRPLDEKLLTYAANDTHFLKTIRDIMREELKALGRLGWHQQACAKMLKTVLNPKEVDKEREENPWKIKGANKLSPLELGFLKELWFWRDKEARRLDRPSFKVLNSEFLIEIAQWAASQPELGDVEAMPKAPRNVRGEHRQTINQVLKQAKSQPLPEIKLTKKAFLGKKAPADFKEKMAHLKEAKDKIAKDLSINSSLLATNASLETIVIESPRTPTELKSLEILLPWQLEILSEPFLQILNA